MGLQPPGRPLHLQHPSAVQLSRPLPRVSSIFPDTSILLKAVERRTMIMRPQLWKVEEVVFGGCSAQIKRLPHSPCSRTSVAKVCFHSLYALSSLSSNSRAHANAFRIAIAHDDPLTCFFFTREAPGYSFPHNLQDQTHRIHMLFGHNLYISSPNCNPPRFLVCRPLR